MQKTQFNVNDNLDRIFLTNLYPNLRSREMRKEETLF